MLRVLGLSKCAFQSRQDGQNEGRGSSTLRMEIAVRAGSGEKVLPRVVTQLESPLSEIGQVFQIDLPNRSRFPGLFKALRTVAAFLNSPNDPGLRPVGIPFFKERGSRVARKLETEGWKRVDRSWKSRLSHTLDRSLPPTSWPARGLLPKGICSVRSGAAFNALYISGQPIDYLPLPRFRLRPSVKPVALFTHEFQWSSRRSAHFGDSHCKHIIGLYSKAITIVTTGTWR
jgi:hypothetical protein